MDEPVNSLDTVRKRLGKQHERLGSWRAVAGLYSEQGFKMNVAYVWKLATEGEIPSSPEARYRLGLEPRPKPSWVAGAVKFLRDREKA